MKTYYAKAEHGAGTVLNREHLARVAEQAGKFGQEIGQAEAAAFAGQFHDFGKYSQRFERVLQGREQGVDHALPGAAFLYAMKGLNRKKPGDALWTKYEPVVEAVQGHHDGLVSMQALAPVLEDVLTQADSDCCPSGKQPAVRGREEFAEAQRAFLADFPAYQPPKLPARTPQNSVENMLDTRMLFSCLVDADYSISASDAQPDYLLKNSGPPLDAEAALQTLQGHCAALRVSSNADPKLNALRDEVFARCGEAGELPPGLFTLTAPTGVGKTLAMLHFALRHCRKNDLRRIIVVLPFLTLAEQSEKEYAKLLPDLLVDHSQKELPEDARELAARWDAPMVITTSVKFFESLFADKPTDCRKLHSLAGSVVLFDEAQSLPAELAPATVQAVNRLCRAYHCSMVFSTATQPDFGTLPGADWAPTELLPDNRTLYRKMQRVQVEWRLYTGAQRLQNPSLAKLAEEMAGDTSVCCILNLRRHARALFAELQKICPAEGLFLLTTDLCPAHRLAVVAEIKARQKAGLPCRVVATQCIEAGVDLDFDRMYRALAPLESIIQAAGRCNRNGRLPQGGQVIVFEPGEEGRLYPGGSYEKAANIVKNLWAEQGTLDLNDPDVIAAYYGRLFARAAGKPALEAALAAKDYPQTAREYRLITQSGVQVIVPWAGEQERFDAVSKEALSHGLTAALLRKAAPIAVSCFERDWVEQHATPVYFAGKVFARKEESGYYILNRGHEACYDAVAGLQINSTLPENYLV